MTLRAQVPVVPTGATDAGALPQSAATSVTLYLQPTQERAAALKQFLADVQTPANAAYHVWLTPAQFGQRFGATPEQTANVTAWAQANGLAVASVSASGLKVSLTGTAAQVENALAPGLHQMEIGGNSYVANTVAPSLAAEVAANVLMVGGLSTLPNARPMTVASAAGTVQADDALAAVSAAVDANTSRVLALSSANCLEDVDAASQAALQLLLRQASVQGITVLAASGCGARGSAGVPAAFSEVTAVATAPGIVTPASATLSEARPSWQHAARLPDDAFRHEPDLTTTDINALAQTVSAILAKMPMAVDEMKARLGNINGTLYDLATIKGLYTQPDNAPGGTWEAATGLGLVDLDKLADVFPRALLSDYVSIDYSPYYVVHGQTVTFVSNVKDTSGAGKTVPTGTVTFTFGSGLSLGPVQLDGSGTARVPTNQLPGGNNSVVANYSGDSIYAANSTSAEGQYENIYVNPEELDVTTSQPLTVPVGSNVLLNVTVKADSGVGTPSGQVKVQPQGIGNSNTYYGTLSAVNGQTGVATATVVIPATVAGSIQSNVFCSTTDPSFSCYQGHNATLNVTKATPTVTLSISPNPPVNGQTATFTANVIGAGNGAPTPTGTVTFTNNGVTIEQPVQLAGGQARLQTSNFNYSANNNFVATYNPNGDNNYNSNSSSSSSTGHIDTTTAISVSPSSLAVGDSATFYAVVTPNNTGTSAITGTVTFTAGGATLCTATLTNGAGSCPGSFSTTGTQNVVGAYNGDNNYNGSSNSSSPFQVTVTAAKGQTTITLTASGTPVAGQATTFTATVAKAAGATGTSAITGSVTFYVNGASIGSSSLNSSGQASLPITLPAGTDTVTATYSGDTNWATSTTTPGLTFTISSTTSTGTMVTTNTDLAVVGTNIVITATISLPAGAGGSNNVSGNVTFYDNYNGQQVVLGTVPVASSGPTLAVAQWTTTGLLRGRHDLSASFAGTNGFGSSTSGIHTIYITDFGLTFAPTSMTLKAGDSGSTTVTISALNGFAGTVSLACIPPAGAAMTCSFNPATISTSGTTTSTLTVTTTAAHAEARPMLLRENGGVALAALGLGCCLAMWRRRKAMFLAVLVSICLLGGLGCTTQIINGSKISGGGTPTGNQNLTISASGTDGVTTVTHSVQFQVNVQ